MLPNILFSRPLLTAHLEPRGGVSTYRCLCEAPTEMTSHSSVAWLVVWSHAIIKKPVWACGEKLDKCAVFASIVAENPSSQRSGAF